MKQIICAMSLLLMTTGAFAQTGKHTEKRNEDKRRSGRMAQKGEGRAERVQAIKIGYLTDKLQLTSSQATAFWPVYNEYQRDLRQARRAFRQKYRNADVQESNAEASRFIEDNLDFQEQAIAIKRKYKDRLLKVISAQQLATLYEAERDFKKLLLQQLREKRGKR